MVVIKKITSCDVRIPEVAGSVVDDRHMFMRFRGGGDGHKSMCTEMCCLLNDGDELDERCFEKEKEGSQSKSELKATEEDEDMIDEDEDDEEDEDGDAEGEGEDEKKNEEYGDEDEDDLEGGEEGDEEVLAAGPMWTTKFPMRWMNMSTLPLLTVKR